MLGIRFCDAYITGRLRSLLAEYSDSQDALVVLAVFYSRQ